MRLGIDLGGTKTEIAGAGAAAAWSCGASGLRRRATMTAPSRPSTELVTEAEDKIGARGSVGMAIPGTQRRPAPIKNANSTWLIGKPLRARSGSRAGPRGAAGQ